MRVLITGCRGFVGGTIGRVAAQAGHEVMGLGLSSQPETDWPGSYQQADVTHADLAPTIRAYAPDMILHAAGTASVGASFAAPLDDARAAVLSLVNTLDGIRRAGCRPLVLFPSSAAVYGNPATLPVSEDAPVVPISPYGYHKAAAELLAGEYCQCFGLDIVVMRLFSVYGPRQRRLLVWELFRKATGAEPEITLEGTGHETRDYLHIDDAAAIALSLATTRPAGLTVLNVASGSETRTAALAHLVARAVGVEKPIRALGHPQTGNPGRWQADVERLNNFGPFLHRRLDEGIAQCVGAWRCA